MISTTERSTCVLVLTRNRSHYLRDTLSTLYPQVGKCNAALIVCDNASTDDEYANVAREIINYNFCTYIRYDHLLPMLENWDRCLQAAKGFKHVAFYHDDDLYEPGIVEAQVAFLEKHLNVGLVGTDSWLIDDKGAVIGEWTESLPDVTKGHDFIDKCMITRRVPLNAPSIMFRRAALENIQFADAKHLNGGDYKAWLKIAETWDVGYIREKLMRYRKHSGQGCVAETQFNAVMSVRGNLIDFANEHLKRNPGACDKVLKWSKAIDSRTAKIIVSTGITYIQRTQGDISKIYEMILSLRLSRSQIFYYKLLVSSISRFCPSKVLDGIRSLKRNISFLKSTLSRLVN